MELRYRTKIDIFQTSLLTVELTCGLFAGLYIILKSINRNNGMLLFGIVLFIICLVQILRVVKRFDLYDGKLVVAHPLAMNSKTNTVVEIKDIKKIIFRNIKGRFGGPVLIINSSKFDETYRINFPKNSIDAFETELKKLGIETVRDGI